MHAAVTYGASDMGTSTMGYVEDVFAMSSLQNHRLRGRFSGDDQGKGTM